MNVAWDVKAFSLSEFKGATVIIFSQTETVEDPEFPFKGSPLKWKMFQPLIILYKVYSETENDKTFLLSDVCHRDHQH